jgi:hypothetical protein
MKPLRLFKRPTSPFYYCEFIYARKRYLHSLATKDAKEAQARARAFYATVQKSVIRGNRTEIEDVRLRRRSAPTLAQLYAHYDTAPVKAGTRARRLNKLSLNLLLRRCGLPGDPAAIPITAITDPIARNWFAQARQQALAAADQLEEQRIETTANSYFNQANSVFSALALDWYKQQGCYAPCLEAFSKTGRMLRFKARGKPMFRTASKPVVTKTLAAWATLTDNSLFAALPVETAYEFRHSTARDVFLAVGHSLAFGLRRGEIDQARWSWWSTEPGYPVLSADGCRVKKRTGRLRVRALDPFFTTMQQRITAEDWRGADTDYIIRGHQTTRTDEIYRLVGAWLRSLGWHTNKTNHALRAWAGSQIAMRYDIYEASRWCRHESVETTESHYSQYVEDFGRENKEDVPVRWAKLEPTPPALQLLPDPIAAAAT